MTIEVGFLAGTSIEDAVSEAKEKCVKWGVAYVGFNFNGVSVSVSARSDPKNASDMLSDCFKNDKTFILVK